MDTSKATGNDNVGPRLLKLAAPYISDDITYICNQSINKSTFPRKWKEAKVSPLHKTGPHDDVHNHRPISILPVQEVFHVYLNKLKMPLLIYFSLYLIIIGFHG